MVSKGDCLKVKTKTLKDVFGTCYYEVVETGLKPPEKGREKEMDGIKCVILGGSGPSAREGFVVYDSQWKVAQDIAAGITEVIPKEQALKFVQNQGTRMAPGEGISRPAIGCVEME